MRITLVMAVAACWLTVQFDQCIQLMRPGSDGKPICTQPPVTQAEIEAGLARRARRWRSVLSTPSRPC